MYRQLKKRFIAYAMLVVSLVLLALVAFINMASYRDMYRRADFVTELITQHKGSFPKDISDQLNTLLS